MSEMTVGRIEQLTHTPGPWAAIDRGVPVVISRGEAVAVISTGTALGGAYSEDTINANARLIAAAPELLAALKQVQEWLLETGQLEDDGITHPLMVKANNLTVAAIAKAEGRS